MTTCPLVEFRAVNNKLTRALKKTTEFHNKSRTSLLSSIKKMTKNQKLELSRKIGLFGLKDLRKLAPIGDLGYANGWNTYYGKGWMFGDMEEAIVKAFYEQREKFGFTCEGTSTGYRRTDHHTYCKELGLRWSVDSGD